MKSTAIHYYIRTLALLLAALALFAFTGCDSGGGGSMPQGIQGVAQKGPFIKGSRVFIQELDNNLVPTGIAYETTTTDDQGSFDLASQLKANVVEISISGFYFNEVTGQLSAAPQTLRLLADLSKGGVANVNVLTQICMARTRTLVTSGIPLADATVQAKSEVLSLFNISSTLITSELHELDLSGPGVANASLLYASAVMLQGRTEAEAALLLAELELDLEQNGVVNNPILTQQMDQSKANVNLTNILGNLTGYYTTLGTVITPPDVGGFEIEMDEVTPEIMAFEPIDGTVDFAIGSPFEIAFTEAMDPASLNGNIILSSLAGPVTCALSTHGNYVTVTPNVDLEYGTAYSLMVTTGVTDLGGNALAMGGETGFITKTAPDTAAPSLIASLPVNGMADVKVGSLIELTFSEEIDLASLSTAISLSDGSVNIPMMMNLQGATLRLAPEAKLAMNQTYWLNVTAGVRDLAGNALDQAYQVSFTTELPVIPTCGFDVISVNPDEEQHHSSVYRTLIITLNQDVNKRSVNKDSLWIYGPDGAVHGRIRVHHDEITFKPFKKLKYGTTYELHLKDIQSTSGESLCTGEVFEFTTKTKHHDHHKDHWEDWNARYDKHEHKHHDHH